jgi:hypothetical protein
MNAPSHTDLYLGLGKMEGRLDAVEDRLSKIEAIAERIDTRLARIEATESQRKGAFSLAHWIIGAVSGVVAFVAAHLWK